MTYSELLKALIPSTAYDTKAPLLTAELDAEGNALDLSSAKAMAVQDGVTPIYADDLLSDWERVLGLSADADSSYQERLQKVLAKLAEIGGLSRDYFIDIARSVGYTITIEELDIFRASESRAGDYLYEDEIIWVWQINVVGGSIPTYLFRAAESSAGDSLEDFGDTIIEATFNDLKPAHTLCLFTYRHQSTGPYYDGSWQFDGSRNFTVNYEP